MSTAKLPRPNRCACSAEGTWDRPIFGRVNGKPHVWPGCPYCRSTVAGQPVPEWVFFRLMEREAS